MNTLQITLLNAKNKRRNKRRGESLSNAAGAAIETTAQKLGETWRNAPQRVRPHSSTGLGYLRTPLIVPCRSVIKTESVVPLQDRSGILLAVEGRKMGDTPAEQGGERSDLPSALIDETCSRFEAAWQAGQEPRIEDFLPAQSPDRGEAARRSLLVNLVGIDLEWRWKTADLPSPPAPLPKVEGSDAYSPRRPWVHGARGAGPGVRAVSSLRSRPGRLASAT